jgi:hypothetical protein
MRTIAPTLMPRAALSRILLSAQRTLLLSLFAAASYAQNVPLSIPRDATATNAPKVEESFPNLDIESSAQVLQKEIHVGEPFDYQVTLSWKGQLTWISLEAPKVEWPKELRQTNVSTGVRSAPGADGPVGSKYFKYTLVSDKAGALSLPDISVQVKPIGKDAFPVKAPGTQIAVKEAVVSGREQMGAFVKKNGIILIGAAFAVAAGLLVFFLKRRAVPSDAVQVADPWVDVEADFKKIDALRSAGESREFYGELEKFLRSALRVATGREDRDLTHALDQEPIPAMAREDWQRLASEIAERKFRPDRPRSEEMDSALRQCRAALRALKESFPKGGIVE